VPYSAAQSRTSGSITPGTPNSAHNSALVKGSAGRVGGVGRVYGARRHPPQQEAFRAKSFARLSNAAFATIRKKSMSALRI
jgi:hypothetical protein